jgi:hypothetical protein
MFELPPVRPATIANERRASCGYQLKSLQQRSFCLSERLGRRRPCQSLRRGRRESGMPIQALFRKQPLYAGLAGALGYGIPDADGADDITAGGADDVTAGTDSALTNGLLGECCRPVHKDRRTAILPSGVPGKSNCVQAAMLPSGRVSGRTALAGAAATAQRQHACG